MHKIMQLQLTLALESNVTSVTLFMEWLWVPDRMV